MERIRLLVIALILGSAHRPSVCLIIPAGPGGGLDATARALGSALVASEIESNVSYENRSGGGGGKAMAYFVSNGDTLRTPFSELSALDCSIIARPVSTFYQDLVPIAGLIADPGVIAVREDSKFQVGRISPAR